MANAVSSIGHPNQASLEEVRAMRKIEVALGYRILAAQRWGDLGDGHISARDPEREDCFWVLRYGVSYHNATVKDLVLIGPNGELVEGEGLINIAAYYIHHPILVARPDAVSATHVHTGWGTPFSAEVRPIEPISQESCVFFEDHAIFDDDEVQVQSLISGQRLATALAENRALILRNHGLLTVGASVAEAVASFVLMERVAEAHLKASRRCPISPQAARFAKADLVGTIADLFVCLVANHIVNPSVVVPSEERERVL
jgi:ribulose-5-phosphate 4-epimerase/fuculose-1-phosphate aldolase